MFFKCRSVLSQVFVLLHNWHAVRLEGKSGIMATKQGLFSLQAPSRISDGAPNAWIRNGSVKDAPSIALKQSKTQPQSQSNSTYSAQVLQSTRHHKTQLVKPLCMSSSWQEPCSDYQKQQAVNQGPTRVPSTASTLPIQVEHNLNVVLRHRK